jgi:phospholipid transport system substrate-binding protein
MIPSRILRSGLFLAGLTLASSLTAAPGVEARSALASGIEEVGAALRERPPGEDLIVRLDLLADKHFAFATATRLAVGPAWRDFTAEQRADATRLFSRLIVRTYAERVVGESQPSVTYGDPLELNGGRIEVPTVISTGGRSYSVSYRLERDQNSKPARWRVYDVIAEGVSLIANYRAQFEPIVGRSGAKGLLSVLESKLAEAPAAIVAGG